MIHSAVHPSVSIQPRADREHEIIRGHYAAQDLPPPDWTLLRRGLRRAMLAGIRTATRQHLPAELLEDLIQEAHLRLYAHDFRALRELRGPMPAAWFGLAKAAASSAVFDHFRRHHCQKRAVTREIPLADCLALASRSAAPDQHLRLREIDRALLRILPPRHVTHYRQIFWLYHHHCFNAREIAALPAVRLSVKGVESALKRMLDGLRIAFTTMTPAGNRPR